MSVRGVQVDQSVLARFRGVVVSVFQNFPNRTLYAVNCVIGTSLGGNIIRAAIPHSAAVLPCANRVKHVTTYLTRLQFLLLIGIVVVSWPSLTASVKPWDARLFRASAVVAAVDMLLSVVYFIFLYLPLRAVMAAGLALVYRVDRTGTGSSNEFIQVEFGQRITVVDADLSSHVFAATLEQEHQITFMIYDKVWFEWHISLLSFIADFTLPLIFVFCWAAHDFTEGWWSSHSLTTTLFSMLLSACLVSILACAWCLLSLAWRIVNVFLCFLPGRLVDWLAASARRRILRRMDGNAADAVSFIRS